MTPAIFKVMRVRPDVYAMADGREYESLSHILEAHLFEHPSLPVCLRYGRLLTSAFIVLSVWCTYACVGSAVVMVDFVCRVFEAQ